MKAEFVEDALGLAENNLQIALEAYRHYRFELDGKWPIRNIAYYRDAEIWLEEQGCRICMFTGTTNVIRWESESRKVEFFLKYVK